MRKTRYQKMMEDGCPECGSPDTHETLASVNCKDNVTACICDSCGHTLVKPKVDVWYVRRGEELLALNFYSEKEAINYILEKNNVKEVWLVKANGKRVDLGLALTKK